MKPVLARVIRREALTAEEARDLMRGVVTGTIDTAFLAGLLVALECKGVTGRELHAFAEGLREMSPEFSRPEGEIVDTCGTGGDGAHTFNVSSASAVLLATMGLRVAKHGNRSVSSSCGSADVLEAVGVPIDLGPDPSARLLRDAGFAYLHAPIHHPGVAQAGPARRALGVRTVFNRLGPLLNPARPSHQLVGVFGMEAALPMAEALALAGTQRALVVHGDGTDEIAAHGRTEGYEVRDHRIIPFSFDPRSANFSLAPLDALRVRSKQDAVDRFDALISGRGREADRLAVALNAGSVLWLTGRSQTLAEGALRVMEVLKTDEPMNLILRLRGLTLETQHA
ncbi:MAG: anthranilate phosphoribosyltransferase [Myxococcota bacterium]